MTDREKLIELLVDVPVNYELCIRIMGQCPTLETPCYECLADYLLANGVTFAKYTDVHSKWISVDDEMPHAEYGESDNVLAVDGFGIVKMLYFDGGCWCRPTGETVVYENPRCRITHWMHLTQPPREWEVSACMETDK